MLNQILSVGIIAFSILLALDTKGKSIGICAFQVVAGILIAAVISL